MPGIFGAVRCPRRGFKHLEAYYRGVWKAVEEESSDRAALAGHAFGKRRAIHPCPRHVVGVDGVPSTYDAAQRWSRGTGDPVLSITDGFIELHPRFTGNAAALDRDCGVLHLGAEWAGAFPLYYTRWEGGLVFASLLRPLSTLTGAEIDRLGLLQFLRQGYVFGRRTPFRGIHRLRPGEALRFDPGTQEMTTLDRSRLWTGEPLAGGPETVDRCLQHLTRTLRGTVQATKPAIMMSGGWDSRTLLAVLTDIREQSSLKDTILGYAHGDTESRALALVRRLCRETGIPIHLEPVDDRVLDPSSLRRDFSRTGTANFPHWHRSGHVLRGLGPQCALSGVFGEVLGGHYGSTMTAGGIGKAVALVREWAGLGLKTGLSRDDPVQAAWEALRLEAVGEHWYLDPAFEASIPDKRGRINVEIQSALERLHSRGVHHPERLVEACITEHRGSQYIAGQSVSSRAAVGAAVPFADRELLHLASRIPARDKVHNALNRAILERLDSSLLNYPMAATLVPSSAPMPIQEASRALRKLWEVGGWRSYFAAGGRIPPPRLGWVNFEFLRDGRALQRVLDDLRADIWDRDAMQRRIERVRSGDYDRRLHPLFDQISQVITADLLLR